MDYETARQFLIGQVLPPGNNPDAFLLRLQQQEAPIPGQLTSILLALKVVFEGLQGVSSLDRELTYALYLLAVESRQAYQRGLKAGADWTPLLDQDLTRIAHAVKCIFSGIWSDRNR